MVTAARGAIAPEEEGSLRRRRLRPWIAGFAGLLLAATFLSGTVERLTLVKAAVAKPELGALERTIEGEGRLVYAETRSLYPEADGRVRTVEVAEGDKVGKGQALLTFDTSDTERALADERDRLKQTDLRLEKLKDQAKEALRGEDEARVKDVRRDIESLETDRRIQLRKIDALRSAVSSGAVLKAPFDGTVVRVDAEPGRQAVRSQAAVVLAPAGKGVELRLTLPADEAELLTPGEQVQLAVRGGDGRIRRKTGTIRFVGESGGSSGAGGTNGSAAGDAAGGDRGSGSAAAGGGTDAAGGAGAGGSGGSNGGGDGAAGSGGSAAGAAGTGGSSASGAEEEIAVRVTGPDVSAGLYARLTVRKASEEPGVLLPSDAIRSDGDGDYVYVVEERRGALGNEYRLRKAQVDKLDEDDGKALIRSGVAPDERVVTETSAPVSEGERVRLE